LAAAQQPEVVSSEQNRQLVVYLEPKLQRNHLVVCLETLLEAQHLDLLAQQEASAQITPTLVHRCLEIPTRLTSLPSASEPRSQQHLLAQASALLLRLVGLEMEVYLVTPNPNKLPLGLAHNNQLQAIPSAVLVQLHNSRPEHQEGYLAITNRSQQADSSAALLQLRALGYLVARRPPLTPTLSAPPLIPKIMVVCSALSQLLRARVCSEMPILRQILVAAVSFLDSEVKTRTKHNKTREVSLVA
jgi:hypothetical protein